MVRILLGGSPCTYWSIARKSGREKQPAGMGWELFLNYKIAKKKFQPDFFLYENNESAAKPIKMQIAEELGQHGRRRRWHHSRSFDRQHKGGGWIDERCNN